MSIPAAHSARISQHVYDNPDDPFPFEVNAVLTIDERDYKILEIVEDKLLGTGYQGAVYQDQATGELIVAHRGTETSLIKPLLKDGAVDAQMVLARANAQTPFAEALTNAAMEMRTNPEFFPQGVAEPLTISHTGHSLGGYHAQQQAWTHGHGGASFNAFGAAGIGNAPAGIVEGSPPFMAYVRATDVVPAASRQYGDVVAFATEPDVAMVMRAGARPGVEGPVGFGRNVVDDALGRHSIDSFVEGGLMTDANRRRALDHQPLFAEHQRSVHTGREWATYAGDVAMPGAVAATADTLRPGSVVLSSPVVGLTQAAAAGVTASAAAFRDTPQPEALAPLQRIDGDAIRHVLEARAGWKDVAADLSDGSARINTGLEGFVETVGKRVQQTISAAKGHAGRATDALGDAVAAGHRRLGEVNQTVANLQADALDAVGLDGLAEWRRARGLDARTDAENAALRVEGGAQALRMAIDVGGRRADGLAEDAADAVAASIAGRSARQRADAEASRAEAEGLRHAAAVIPEVLYGATAPNLDMRATARGKIEALYAEHGRPVPSPEQLDRLGAAVVADARGQGMTRIEAVMFSQGKGNGPNYEGNLIVFDRDPMNEFSRHSATPIGKALETPVEQSVERTRAANERQEQLQFELQQMQARDQAMAESQGMTMRIGARTMDGSGGAGAAAGGDGGG